MTSTWKRSETRLAAVPGSGVPSPGSIAVPTPTLAIALCLALALLASCAGGPPKGAPNSQPVLSEGQLQEKYIAKRNEAKSLLERRQYGRALDAYLEANRIRPASSDTLLGIGESYVGLEYYERAKEYFDRFLEVDKEHDSATYYTIAQVYWGELGLSDAAIRLLTVAIGSSPERGSGWYYLLRGTIYAKMAKADSATADLNEALATGQALKDARLVAEANDALLALSGP